MRLKARDDLKRRLERTMAKSTFVYVTYIRTTQEKLWSALTDSPVVVRSRATTKEASPDHPAIHRWYWTEGPHANGKIHDGK